MAKYRETQFAGKLFQDQREKVIERDESCVVCGNEDAKTVHHIVPRSEFETGEEAHALNNLVLVCNTPCHWELEDLEPEQQRAEYLTEEDV